MLMIVRTSSVRLRYVHHPYVYGTYMYELEFHNFDVKLENTHTSAFNVRLAGRMLEDEKLNDFQIDDHPVEKTSSSAYYVICARSTRK